MDQKNQNEYMQSFRDAFIENKADLIMIDGRTNEFLRSCVDFGLDNEIIKYDKLASNMRSDSQWTTLCYRLTESGKEVLENLGSQLELEIV